MISDALLAKLDTLTAGSATRLAGADRYATAVAVSAATYPTHVTTLYVATGAAFADGLAAGPVAGLAGGPLLLVGRDTLPSVVSAEIRRLDPSTVVVVGGSGSVSEAVRSQIEGL
jgi:putative cell wall-binding protein